ncbi:alpha/beta hydrolase [Streptomyces sp. AV19]|uniref:alpha/beta fold hydrolase n=1 Tax=Streptomyces sp. AV19 TaxID=2793068 RepID=UPI0018FE416A|nr:alpha/beta hydrolase [Streptomyces sp. AV19]MBH1937620.1 alpha/beta hydrolase [Streptomyces sp. AV19]MDG4536288.1 alpha/beta hydrolase [Streptomyces sp. AV19]
MAYAEVNGTRLHYEDEGTGRPLLFLHGFGTSGRVWDAQRPEFVRDHRVVTVDWRGCGRSDHPLPGNDMATVVADLVGLIEVLGLDRPVVVGSSIGAAFAIELALRHPELVGGAVSVDGSAHWVSLGFPVQPLLDGLAANRAGTVAGWVPEWYGPDAPAELARSTVRQILDSGVYIDAHFLEAVTYDPRPRLPELRVPVHYVHGELSHIPLEISRECAELSPGAELRVVAGAAHMPHQERVGEFNGVLRELLLVG